MTPGQAAATHSVVTAVVLLAAQVGAHNHVHLDNDTLGLVLFVANTFAHAARPYVAAVLNKVLPKVTPDA